MLSLIKLPRAFLHRWFVSQALLAADADPYSHKCNPTTEEWFELLFNETEVSMLKAWQSVELQLLTCSKSLLMDRHESKRSQTWHWRRHLPLILMHETWWFSKGFLFITSQPQICKHTAEVMELEDVPSHFKFTLTTVKKFTNDT